MQCNTCNAMHALQLGAHTPDRRIFGDGMGRKVTLQAKHLKMEQMGTE